MVPGNQTHTNATKCEKENISLNCNSYIRRVKRFLFDLNSFD